MKKISIMIPCFNEEENIVQIGEACEKEIQEKLPNYDYEICYVDNASTDKTRQLIEEVCAKNKKHKAIFNVTNFGQFNSPFHGICSLDGDCVIPVCADFQDPVEMIPVFVHEWEQGHKIVSGVKASSKENGFVYFLRSVYYRTIKRMSSVPMIEHFTGFGLYDKSFVKLLRELQDPLPFIRGIVAEYGEGFNLKTVEYEQPQRRAGVTHNNFYTLYDAAMLSFTSYTKSGLRMMTFLGFGIGVIDVIVAIVYFVMKLLNWDDFAVGMAPLVIGMFGLGAIQLVFMGFMGEYILNINTRTINRPIVVEEKRINFD
ncbi:glycosyltransferase family 2 protein [Pseudobutyrivibrio xylanivorans]|uniref:Glycosyl transferase family 2 n=1 Tax=Pseudobutyrivibrio xylanivorans TaxID=185007 RepID=A0A5P6VV29_PSEXY|nr:glycosyltransferase family 2 protein [Pseudobutyrivibrio xylanivorans]QFJ56138.1 glycosyl transferase family 2 [Pseudobutyrivibrio xylanivorans]